MSVPILVIVFFVLAFVTVTILFRFLRVSPDQPNANPLAVQDNSRPLNDRMGDIHLGGKVDQPRLETLRLRSGDARAITRPELPTGNSPELHADQLHPSPENTPALYESGWLDPNKTVAHITIDDAMKAALAPASKLFPAQKDGTGPAQSTNIPTAANAGRGRAESTATPPNPKDPVHQEKDEKKEGKKEGKH
jgi:hypothetical protein